MKLEVSSMVLTPLDIHNKEFPVKMRGYDQDEVNDYLDQIIKDYEMVLKEKRELEKQLKFSEEKVERMATDEEYRKQYEGIIMNATAQLSQMKQGFESTGANVQGYGIQVDDNGTASYFAVLKKASAAQKERIAEQQAEKKAEKKASEKKAEEKAREEWLKDLVKANKADEITVVSASSVEELLQKISDFAYEERSNAVQTPEEKMVGQHFDFQI